MRITNLGITILLLKTTISMLLDNIYQPKRLQDIITKDYFVIENALIRHRDDYMTNLNYRQPGMSNDEIRLLRLARGYFNKSCEYLNLSDLNLTELPINALRNMKALKILDLSNNSRLKLSDQDISNMSFSIKK